VLPSTIFFSALACRRLRAERIIRRRGSSNTDNSMSLTRKPSLKLKAARVLEENCTHRPVQYLDNVLEQDHRAITRRVRASELNCRSSTFPLARLQSCNTSRELKASLGNKRVIGNTKNVQRAGWEESRGDRSLNFVVRSYFIKPAGHYNTLCRRNVQKNEDLISDKSFGKIAR
jgi:hypothetical protein